VLRIVKLAAMSEHNPGAQTSVGLLDIAKRAADHLIEPPAAPPEHGERQLLGRIMHYLKGLMTR